MFSLWYCLLRCKKKRLLSFGPSKLEPRRLLPRWQGHRFCFSSPAFPGPGGHFRSGAPLSSALRPALSPPAPCAALPSSQQHDALPGPRVPTRPRPRTPHGRGTARRISRTSKRCRDGSAGDVAGTWAGPRAGMMGWTGAARGWLTRGLLDAVAEAVWPRLACGTDGWLACCASHADRHPCTVVLKSPTRSDRWD